MKIEKAQWKKALIIFGVSLLFMCLLSLIRNAPGYMDEAYYLLGGQNLYRGEGFYENILWNYLDDPTTIPHPSHLYWMPGASVVAFGGMLLWGSENYFAATFLFSVLAAVIPALTYLLAINYTRDKLISWMACGFSFFGGYYLAYYSSIETFTLYMLLGTGFLGLAGLWKPEKQWPFNFKAIMLGLTAGLMHMTRADGILWLGCAVFVLFFETVWQARAEPMQKRLPRFLLLAVVSASAYLLVMFPWYSRNVDLFGQLSVPGASQTMFLTQYDDLFIYPASKLSFAAFLDQGVGQIIMVRVRSFWMNFLSFLGVQNLVFLLPFAIVSLWMRRKESLVIYLVFAWAANMVLMSIIFPFSGSRGGYFHSASAQQIWLNIFAAIGFGEFIHWMANKRKWKEQQSKRVLGIGFLLIFAFCSIGIALGKLMPVDATKGGWGSDQKKFLVIDQTLIDMGIPSDMPILVNDPPGYTAATRRPSLVIPNGDINMLIAVMGRYQVDIVVLQDDHPQKLQNLYSGAEQTDQLQLLFIDQGFQIWQRN